MKRERASENDLINKRRHEHLHTVDSEQSTNVVCPVSVLAIVHQALVNTADDGIT